MTISPEKDRVELPQDLAEDPAPELTPEARAFLESENMEALVAEWSEQGYVLQGDLDKMMYDYGLVAEDYPGVYSYFRQLELDVTDPKEKLADDEKPYVVDNSEGSTDPLQVFLRAIGKHELLTARQEVELSIRMQPYVQLREEARILAEIKAESRPPEERKSRKQFFEDFARILDERVDSLEPGSSEYDEVLRGKQAFNLFVESNLRLVVSVAKQSRNRGLPFLDLIQEGSIGLIRAVEKFDHTKGYKFSTYATWWIKQAVTRGLADKSRTIRLPVHVVEKYNRIINTTIRLTQDNGEAPTPDQVAEELEMKTEEVTSILKSAEPPRSLEKPFDEEGDFSLDDIVADDSILPPEEQAEQVFRSVALGRVIDQLDDRLREVITLRHGLGNDGPMTLEEVGRKIGVTRERVRQIETEALRRLVFLAKDLGVEDLLKI
jgi:RNA polymerase primary sigma factor